MESLSPADSPNELATPASQEMVVFSPMSTEIEVATDDAYALPLAQLMTMGTSFQMLADAAQPLASAAQGPTLLAVTDAAGNPLPASLLMWCKDGSGMLGGYHDAQNQLHQARFHAVSPTAQANGGLPMVPSQMMMAVAVVQIMDKLDQITETQQAMFDYLKDRDRATIRGNIETLYRLMRDYSYNTENDTWLANAHMKALDIQQSSAASAIHLRAQIKKALQRFRGLGSRIGLGAGLDEVLDRLKELQLTSYAYCLGSFAEPVFSKNFDSGYLDAITESVREQSLSYRETYTDCYNAVEGKAQGSWDAAVLGGLSAALKTVGDAVAATPVGDKTLIDENLQGAGKELASLNEKQTRDLMDRLRGAQPPDMSPFIQGLSSLGKLFSQPFRLAIDSEALYLLPAGEAQTA